MKRLYESVGSPGSGQWKRTRVLNSGSAASSHLRCGHRIWLWILSRVSLRCRPSPSLLAVRWCVLNSISLVLSQLLAAPSECVPQQSATGEGREIHLQKELVNGDRFCVGSKMQFAWIVAATICLLMSITAEACSKGNVSASKLPHGVAEICEKGNMTANTAAHVQPGTNITLSCQLKQLKYSEQCKIALFFNSSELTSNYGTSVSNTFPVNTYGKHMFTCKIDCEYKKKLICGIDIESGNPPDQPRNVSCIQDGTDGNLTCTWDKGRFTHMNTTYVIQLSDGTDTSCFSEESLSNKFGWLVLSTKLNFEATYRLVVVASNKLGSAFSQPLKFMLIDVVKPHPPNFLVEFENSATNCTLFWHSEVRGQHCRVRYRPVSSSTWNMVENLESEKCSLHGLEPHTEYEFQVSCKIHPERGLWSNWSAFRSQTPEAVPTGLLDVWYKKQDIDSQMQNISLFWKALQKSEARGKILHYTVTFEALSHGEPKATETNATTQTSYTKAAPKMDYKITVTADNSRGSSPPASILTNLSIQDLPSPRNVSAVAMGNNSILVSWKPPIKSTASINGYVVEWINTHRKNSLEPHPSWIRLVASNLSIVIPEHIEDNVCYHISVFALYQDRAGQAKSVRGYSREKAPSAGPQVSTKPQTNGLLVWWEEIPSHQQMGCITQYNIYLQKKNSNVDPYVYAICNTTSQHSFYITDLQSGECYVLWMTALTDAGESPWGNSELVCLESAVDWIIVLTCSFFILSACICSLRPARKLSLLLFSAAVPQWYNKAIPDPANATWAKNDKSRKQGELSVPSSLLLHNTSSFEEPETTEVEESFVQTDRLIFSSSSNRDWQLKSSFEKQESEYRPLPSTTDGDGYEHQLPDLYKKMVLEVTEQTQPVSEYIATPITDRATAYLPSAISPLVTDTTEEDPELEYNPISVFPTTFLPPEFSYGGKLNLDTVRLNCSSFTR
ncbi:interleukin-12 receptor subunit beta-2 isoform X1 [Centrocercus urophasianus]|uniref:interleukin-12 receptor subunit beta-2 isoform X1 n=1 Tax=Centrocercus urophasianus TaxID=9002 RepID=UPI001C64E7E1|nr:interleukin-12 receptor subunit beta-2 isoform X1 [Centrocercus urophasianus]